MTRTFKKISDHASPQAPFLYLGIFQIYSKRQSNSCFRDGFEILSSLSPRLAEFQGQRTKSNLFAIQRWGGKRWSHYFPKGTNRKVNISYTRMDLELVPLIPFSATLTIHPHDSNTTSLLTESHYIRFCICTNQ